MLVMVEVWLRIQEMNVKSSPCFCVCVCVDKNNVAEE